MKAQIKNKDSRYWIKKAALFAAVEPKTLKSKAISGAKMNLPMGVPLLFSMAVVLTTAFFILGMIGHGYYQKIETEHRLDFQNKLFQLKVFYYEKTVNDLLDKAQVRREKESQMLAFMNRYDSPLSQSQRKAYIRFLVNEARKYDLDPSLVLSLVAVESAFDPKVVSSKGAVGMTQLLPYVAKAMSKNAGVSWNGRETLEDPFTNTRIGLYYFHSLMERFGNANLALEAYNHGPAGLVRKIKSGNTPSIYSAKILTLAKQFNV